MPNVGKDVSKLELLDTMLSSCLYPLEIIWYYLADFKSQQFHFTLAHVHQKPYKNIHEGTKAFTKFLPGWGVSFPFFPFFFSINISCLFFFQKMYEEFCKKTPVFITANKRIRPNMMINGRMVKQKFPN